VITTILGMVCRLRSTGVHKMRPAASRPKCFNLAQKWFSCELTHAVLHCLTAFVIDYLILAAFYCISALKLDINAKMYGRISKMSLASGGFAHWSPYQMLCPCTPLGHRHQTPVVVADLFVALAFK